jgi:hypothetical protein
VFAFRLPYDRYFPTEEERIGPTLLEDLARDTGGSIVEFDGVPSARDRDRLGVALDRGYDEMAQFYEVAVELSSGLKKERRWDLEIVDEQGKRRKDVKVYYPRELPACSVDLQ